jgi:hypothetical protein
MGITSCTSGVLLFEIFFVAPTKSCKRRVMSNNTPDHDCRILTFSKGKSFSSKCHSGFVS